GRGTPSRSRTPGKRRPGSILPSIRLGSTSRSRGPNHFSGTRVRGRALASVVLVAALGSTAVVPRTVAAHALAPSLLQVRQTGSGRVEVLWRTPVAGVPDAGPRPGFPPPCPRLR